MKKTLLSIALLGAAFVASSQTLILKDNFNSYTTGNLGTDLTGVTAGQGGWFTQTGTSGNNNATQIVAVGTSTTDKALKLTGLNSPSATGTTRNAYRDLSNATTGWPSRISGQDIIMVDFDLSTGPAGVTSKNQFNVYLNDASGNRLIGVNYTPETRKIDATIIVPGSSAGTFAVSGYQLGWDDATNTPKDLILKEDTVVHISFAYNTVTGRAKWDVYHGKNFNKWDYFGVASNNDLKGKNPDEINFYVSAGATNASSASVSFDNIEIAAQSCMSPVYAYFGYDSAASKCKGAADITPQLVYTTIGGTTEQTKGVYSSTAGLVIDATTGKINMSTSTVGTYDVTLTTNASASANASLSMGCSEKHIEKITIKNCASLDEIVENKFSVYPNPANDVVSVSLSNELSNGTIRLLSADGKVIESREFNNSTLENFDVKALNSGVYFFQVGNTTEKVIIK